MSDTTDRGAGSGVCRMSAVTQPRMNSSDDEWVAWHLHEVRDDPPEEQAASLWRAAMVTMYLVKAYRAICDRYGWEQFDVAVIRRDVRVARRLNHLSLASYREATNERD